MRRDVTSKFTFVAILNARIEQTLAPAFNATTAGVTARFHGPSHETQLGQLPLLCTYWVKLGALLVEDSRDGAQNTWPGVDCRSVSSRQRAGEIVLDTTGESVVLELGSLKNS